MDNFVTPNAQKLYFAAKAALGTRQTLDLSVPPEVGCAEAISAILKQIGLPIPTQGIPGTANLLTFLETSGLFHELNMPELSAIIISPTGQSTKGALHGHVGICLKYGIGSNDSQSGLYLELWDIPKWNQYYGCTLGFPVRYFRVL